MTSTWYVKGPRHRSLIQLGHQGDRLQFGSKNLKHDTLVSLRLVPLSGMRTSFKECHHSERRFTDLGLDDLVKKGPIQ